MRQMSLPLLCLGIGLCSYVSVLWFIKTVLQ